MARHDEQSAGADGTWAARTLARAMWQSSALGLAGWQLVVGIYVALQTPRAEVPLLVAHVVLALAALPAAAARSEAVQAAWFGGLMALLCADLAVTTDPAATAVVCMAFVVVATPALVMRARTALPLVSTGVALALTLSVTVRSSVRIATAIGVPVLCFTAVAAGLVWALRRYAASVDALDVAVAADRDRLTASRAAAGTAAEHARVLHDTAINTLAAIASGGPAVGDEGRVRRRCAQDVASIRALGPRRPPLLRHPGSLGVGLGLAVEWTGLAATERERAIDGLGGDRSAALVGIVHELLLNVEKHAATDRVRIHVTADDAGLAVTVSDDGAGFVLDPQPGRGLAESVVRRAAEAGFDVAVDTAPGAGTRVRVTCPPRGEPDPGAAHDEAAVGAEQLRRFATWGWCVAVTSASLVGGAAGTGTPATYASVGVVALACAVAWACCRGGRALPGVVALLLAAATPVAFVLGFLGATGPGGDPIFWQAIGLTPLLVVLLNTARSPWPLVVACLGLAAATLGCATTGDAGDGAAAIANGAMQLAQLGVWLLFTRVLDTITAHAVAARRRARLVLAEQAAVQTASTTQQHWREAQLDHALELLEDVAAGRRSATDPDVRSQARQEENLLRQTVMLTPALVHLGPWLARTLGESRHRDIHPSVRTGDRDFPDAETARAAGTTMTRLLDIAPRGTELVIAYFGSSTDAPLTVVGPSGFSAGLDLGIASGSSCDVRRRHLSSQDIVEIVPLRAS